MNRASWNRLTRQEKAVYKLLQFNAQYSREEKDGNDVIVIIEKRDYWNRNALLSETRYRVSPDGKVTEIP